MEWWRAVSGFVSLAFRWTSRTPDFFDWLGIASIFGSVGGIGVLVAIGRWMDTDSRSGITPMMPDYTFTIALPALGVAALFLVAGVRLQRRLNTVLSPGKNQKTIANLYQELQRLDALFEKGRFTTVPEQKMQEDLGEIRAAIVNSLNGVHRPDSVEKFRTNTASGDDLVGRAAAGNYAFLLEVLNRRNGLRGVLAQLEGELRR